MMMRLLVLIFLSAGVLEGSQRGATAPAPPELVGRAFDARVVRVADGDTIEAIPQGESRALRIRLHGIDAPEQGESFSREAQAMLRMLVFDQRVRVEGRDRDRYGRLVARVSSGGKDASIELVRAGLACHAYVRDSALAAEEAQARSSRRGFWSAANRPACVERTAFSAREPGAARDVSREPPPAGFRGNVSAGVYHASTCPNFGCRNCTRLFATERDAKAAGFRPAADCAR